MSAVISAIKQVYYMNNGAAYDKVALQVLALYKRGGPHMVTAFLQTKEMQADPCAKLFREILKIKTINSSTKMFSFCQPKPGGGSPEWGTNHGWRINKWPTTMPYIHPTPTK